MASSTLMEGMKTFFITFFILSKIVPNDANGNYLPMNTIVRLLPFLQSSSAQQQEAPQVQPQPSEGPDGQSKIFYRPPPAFPNFTPLLHQIQTGYYNELFVIPGRGNGFPWHIIQTNQPTGFPSAFSQGGGIPPSISAGLAPAKDIHDKRPAIDESEDRFAIRENVCSHFSHEGRCFKKADCTSANGRLTTYCRDYTKFCCIFYMSCGSTTSEEALYFRSSSWPGKAALKGSCSITISKKSNDICFIRVNPKNLILPASIGYCNDIAFEAEVSGKKYQSLCGRLTDEAYTIDVNSVDSVKLQIRSDVTSALIWEIGVTQVLCSETPGRLWPEKGVKTVSVPVSTSPVKPIVGETAKPEESVAPTIPAKKVCGKKGKKIDGSRDDDFSLAFTQQEGGLPDLEEDTRGEQDYTIYNPLLTTLDWDVPVVNESIFYRYAFDTPPVVSGRVTYGKKTYPNQYRWNIAMYRNGRYHCGGTLISEGHVLTAAHCVSKYKARPYSLTIKAGDWDINSASDGHGVTANIARIVTHPGYSTVTLKFDLAVLTLKKNLTLSDTLMPICLPSPDMKLDGEIVTVTGWGRNQKNKLQSQLMEHSAAVVPQAECNKRWKAKGAPANIIADTMLCMDPQYGDSCKGDSGGPCIMEVPKGSGNFQQMGIVSFGSASCTDKLLPGVYTKVTKVVGWIKQQMV